MLLRIASSAARGGAWMGAHIRLIPTQYPDPRTMGPDGAGVEATMARYGGGDQSVLRHWVTPWEGDWPPPKGVTILAFPSSEQALAWYHSPEYAPVRALRMATGRCDVILVDGLSADDPATTGQRDAWEIERIAELEAEAAQAHRNPASTASGPP
jgi:uncharacterized protein (DUF1330 family)